MCNSVVLEDVSTEKIVPQTEDKCCEDASLCQAIYPKEKISDCERCCLPRAAILQSQTTSTGLPREENGSHYHPSQLQKDGNKTDLSGNKISRNCPPEMLEGTKGKKVEEMPCGAAR